MGSHSKWKAHHLKGNAMLMFRAAVLKKPEWYTGTAKAIITHVSPLARCPGNHVSLVFPRVSGWCHHGPPSSLLQLPGCLQLRLPRLGPKVPDSSTDSYAHANSVCLLPQGGEATAQAVCPCAAIIAAGLWVLSAPRAQENWAVPTEGSTREITWGMLTLSDLVRIYLVAGYPENIPSKALFYF